MDGVEYEFLGWYKGEYRWDFSTAVTISAKDIELNKQGQWYVYIQGGDGAGAAADGWKISTIYAVKA